MPNAHLCAADSLKPNTKHHKTQLCAVRSLYPSTAVARQNSINTPPINTNTLVNSHFCIPNKHLIPHSKLLSSTLVLSPQTIYVFVHFYLAKNSQPNIP